MVTVQQAMYDILGVSFPKWKNRSLQLKEIEHALCEYSKYKRMVAGMDAKVRCRDRWSSAVDANDPCQTCELNKDGMFCDTCFLFYCCDCLADDSKQVHPDKFDGSWSCYRCCAFATLRFAS